MQPIYESIINNANTSFKVESYGIDSICASAGWHIHPEYEIVYVKNGSGSFRIGNRTHDYKNGVLVFLGGNIPHTDLGNTEEPTKKEVVVQFSKKFVDEKLALFPELANIRWLVELSKHVLIFDDKVKDRLAAKFEDFDQQDTQGKLINLLSILDHLSMSGNYFKLLNSNPLQIFREKETHRLEKIFEYINSNYSQKITVADIAVKVGLTPNSFSRFFKKMTKRTFVDFVNDFRIRKAIDKMNENNITIADAMFHSGYRSPSYFTKQFLKYQKMTPSAYLKEIKSF